MYPCTSANAVVLMLSVEIMVRTIVLCSCPHVKLRHILVPLVQGVAK
jgi:hypothetical protein